MHYNVETTFVKVNWNQPMAKKHTQAEQMKIDWIAYNKRQRDPKLKMSFDEYSKWVTGKSRPRIKATSKIPTYDLPCWATSNKSVKSLKEKGTHVAAKNTIVEQVLLGNIVGTQAKEIMNKTKRIALVTSKGAYGYIGENFDPRDIGKKTQQLNLETEV